MPGSMYAVVAFGDNSGCSCRRPVVLVFSLLSLGKITAVDFAVEIFFKIGLSLSLIKCLLAPLSALSVTFLGESRWATGDSLIVLKVLFILFSKSLLTNTGPTCQVIFLVLPPIRFCSVASFLWPSAGVRQSGLSWLQRPCV